MEKIKRSIECSRCPRVEDTEISLEQAIELANERKNGAKKPEALVLTLDGAVVATYEKLCSTCRNVVMNLCEGVSRKADKVSSQRVRKPKAKEKGPVAPAPAKATPAAPSASQKR